MSGKNVKKGCGLTVQDTSLSYTIRHSRLFHKGYDLAFRNHIPLL